MKKILLVDDHSSIRNGIKFYFEDSQVYQISSEAGNGLEALEKLKHQNFDLIITDISMPEMDGIELIRNIKELDKDMKIMALTMHGEAKIVQQVTQLGINGYIMKNSGKEKVLEAIRLIFNGETYFLNETN